MRDTRVQGSAEELGTIVRRIIAVAVAIFAVLPVVPAHADKGEGSPNMRHVATLRYKPRYGQRIPFGTDIEFARIAGRDYAFAGTYRNGLQIVDITDPRKPTLTAVYDCAIAQGDVQVFRRSRRTLVAYAADDIPSQTKIESACFRDNDVDRRTYGTFLVDVTDPSRPRSAGFAEIPAGSHNQSVHPSGRYMYNSNADLALGGSIEVLDIRDLAHAKKVAELPLQTGLESHDITFSADGKRAYVAALTHTLVLDTSDPARPKVIGRIIDPAINIHHQADPLTIDDPVLGPRTFLIVTDEIAGAAGNAVCPGGGLHVFDITGPLEQAPVKVGFWAIPDARPVTGEFVCTSHVMRFYPKHKLMTIAWYNAGVHVVDVSGLAGVSVGGLPSAGNVGVGMKEIGSYVAPDAFTWSAKTNRIAKDGSFYLFGNDMNRGLDVYRFDAQRPRPGITGTWLTPEEALARAGVRSPWMPRTFQPMCVLGFGRSS
jgi:hypothetical protein